MIWSALGLRAGEVCVHCSKMCFTATGASSPMVTTGLAGWPSCADCTENEVWRVWVRATNGHHHCVSHVIVACETYYKTSTYKNTCEAVPLVRAREGKRVMSSPVTISQSSTP